MRGILAGSLGVTLALFVASARAEDFAWRPTAAPPRATVRLGEPIFQETSAATLGRAQPLTTAAKKGTVPLSSPSASYRVARAQSPELAVPPLPAPVPAAAPLSTTELYNCGVVTKKAGTGFLEGGKDLFSKIPGVAGVLEAGGGRLPFQSDHAFDGFISPVTNPFFFEDPRALTEVRPMFLYQATPLRNPTFHGGDIEFFGTQVRVAFTDHLSLVMNKLGGIWTEVHNPTPDFQSHAGFAEIALGPKFTFWRNENTGTVAALGLTFDFPSGDRHVLQDTGSLTLEPYLTLAQRIYRSRLGTFNGMGTFGYNFSVDNKRSDNLFTSLHLDLDYGDLHVIYPLVEFHWFNYTKNGKARDLNFEGRDLFNFGSQHISGHNELSIAVGARYKFNECLQLGLAAEVPFNHQRGLEDFRITFDVILRY